VLAEFGPFDEAIAQTDAAVRIAEAADQPLTVVADAVEEFLRRQYFVRPGAHPSVCGDDLPFGRTNRRGRAWGVEGDIIDESKTERNDDRSAVMGTSAYCFPDFRDAANPSRVCHRCFLA
jgi:hypothetical protein